jgi:uncharacterized protein
MIRLLIFLLIVYFGYRAVKRLVGSLFLPQDKYAEVEQDTDLIADPHCGTYFLKQSGVKADIQGKTVYFCSSACRDAYMQEHRSA